MSRFLTTAAAIFLILHGLIHLMGTTVYLKLGAVEGLSYKTALLDGRWEVGESGMRVFGVLWGLAALGFVLAAVAWLAGWAWWLPALVVVTLFSLGLTGLDWRQAFAGVVINLVILAALWLGPHLLTGR